MLKSNFVVYKISSRLLKKNDARIRDKIATLMFYFCFIVIQFLLVVREHNFVRCVS